MEITVIILAIVLVLLVAILYKLHNESKAHTTEMQTLRDSNIAAETKLQHSSEEIAKKDEELQQLRSKLDEAAQTVAGHRAIEAEMNEKLKQAELQKEELDKTLLKLDEAKETISALKENKASLQEKIELAKQTQEQLEKLKEQQKAEFTNLSNQIIKQQSKEFAENGSKSIGDLLNPLRSQLDAFNKAINDYSNKQEVNEKALRARLEDLRKLNNDMSKEAQELSNALRKSGKVQGDWGEKVLQQILDMSGLKEGVSYDVQVTKNDDGKIIKSDTGGSLRPDVILNMPDGKHIIIDSKTSLTAFIKYANANSEEERLNALKEHVTSMRNHLDELAAKDYAGHVQNAHGTVFMFVPNESAYIVAMDFDKDLWQDAYKKNIVIVSPTHLISVMQLLSQLWARENQNKNAVEIGRQVGVMLTKLQNSLTSLKDVEKYIDKAHEAYETAYSRLVSGKGNMATTGKKIEKLAGLPATTLKLPENYSNDSENDTDEVNDTI